MVRVAVPLLISAFSLWGASWSALGAMDGLGCAAGKLRPFVSGDVNLDNLAIPAAQAALAESRVPKGVLEKTFFILPRNDLESARAVSVLESYRKTRAKMFVSDAKWGGKLTPEKIDELRAAGRLDRSVSEVVLLELPSREVEEHLRSLGYKVKVIDHHKYDWDVTHARFREKSSLEQLMDLLKWPASSTDFAIAIADREYVWGLKNRFGLTADEIRKFQRHEWIIQGLTPEAADEALFRARKIVESGGVPFLFSKNGKKVFIIDTENPAFHLSSEVLRGVRFELALRSPGGVAHVLDISSTRFGFSGSPEMVKSLEKLNYGGLGYATIPYRTGSNGSAGGTKVFRFSPEGKPSMPYQGNKKHKISEDLVQALRKLIEDSEL